MKIIVQVLILLVAASHGLCAQQEARQTASLTGGYSWNDFRYVEPGNPFPYDFSASFPVLMLSWERIYLSFGYGTQEADPAFDLHAMKMLEASLNTGFNIFLFKNLFDSGFGIFLPVRAIIDYRYVTAEHDNFFQEIRDLNLLSAGLGLGIGVRVQAITTGPGVVLVGSVVSSLGVQGDVSGAYLEDYRLTRGADFNVELKIGRLTLGYTFRSLRWTNMSPESFQDVLDAIKHPKDIPKRRGQSLVRLGFNW